VGVVKELGVSSDGNIRSAEVQLASGRVIRRPLNLLFPIETSQRLSFEVGSASSTQCTSQRKVVDASSTQCTSPRPQRKAAIHALQRIKASQ